MMVRRYQHETCYAKTVTLLNITVQNAVIQLLVNPVVNLDILQVMMCV